MADATVAFDGVRVNNADALGSVWTDLGGGKAASEPDFIYQGTAAVSEKVGTTAGGVALDTGGTTYDYTTPRVWLAKLIATNSAALNNKGSTGGILEIGSGGRRSAYDRYYVIGGDTYPIQGGWQIIPIDPNGGNQSARPGTAPTLTAINFWGFECDFGATSKAENVALDAVDHITNGTGLTLTDGIGGVDGTFDLFATTDEDTAGNNRWGVVSTREGILYVTGVLTIGDSGTGAEFTDSGAVVVWPDAEFLNSLGFFGLDFNLQNASTVISCTNCTFISRGTSGGTVDTRAVVEAIGTSGALTLSGCNFQNLADFIMTSAATLTGCTIETADMTQGSCDISDSTIITNSAANVACLTDPTFGSSTDLHDCTFSQGGSGHALEINAAGTYNFNELTFSGYNVANGQSDSAIYVSAASGTVNINTSGGTATPTYRTAGATVNVSAAITITFTGLIAGTEVRVYKVSDGLEEDGTESTAGTTFAASLQASTSYNIVVIAKGYEPQRFEAQSFTGTQNFPVNLQPDANYNNP